MSPERKTRLGRGAHAWCPACPDRGSAWLRGEVPGRSRADLPLPIPTASVTKFRRRRIP